MAFVDFDQELLAPRVRAGEEALALLAHASRLVGGRPGPGPGPDPNPGSPRHPGGRAGRPRRAGLGRGEVRRALRLPPVTAVALVSGPGAPAYVAGLRGAGAEVLGPDGDRWLVKAGDAATLADQLAAVPRPPARLRVAVDPARL